MSVAGCVIVGVLAVAAYAVYQLVKAKKAVTVGDVVSTVKSDAAAVKSDVKKS
jgi:ABC-type spermidine/putrescine transport system permease subunit I